MKTISELPLISVIIPTKNEEEGISLVLKQLLAVNIDEIIVVDGSEDETATIAKKMGATIVIETRSGYGRALQTGIEKAKGEIIVYIDGDYTYDPSDIHKLIEPIIKGEADVVLGNRFRGKIEKGSMKTLNIIGNKLLSKILSLLYSKQINDTQTGFRAFRKELVHKFTYSNYGMPYVTEQLLKFIKNGAMIKEISISYKKRIGKSKLSPLRDGFKILTTIFLLRINNV
jgi:glycosyltransferase involved in cell wall biosynthesis